MAGMVSNPIKCTPKDKPITNEIKINHLLPLGVFISASHLRPR